MRKESKHSRLVAYEQNFRKKIEQDTRRNSLNSKDISRLILEGRKLYFEEYFEGKNAVVEEGPIKQGYDQGKLLVEHGFSLENYHNF